MNFNPAELGYISLKVLNHIWKNVQKICEPKVDLHQKIDNLFPTEK